MSTKRDIRKELLRRVLVLDGAMGTALQDVAPGPNPEWEGCPEALMLDRPEVVEAVHRSHLQAGADILETNTFGGAPLVLEEFGLGHRCEELNEKAARVARKVAGDQAFVAGSMGPTTRAISVTGGIGFWELEDQFARQATGLLKGGVDYLLLETSQDTRNIKAGILGIQRAMDQTKISVPIAVSGTIEPMGTMLAGQGVEALASALEHVDLLYLGLNCATGPEFMRDHLRTLAAQAPWPLACVPNAGLPDEEGRYLETPSMMAEVLGDFLAKGWLNLVGGCCGTTAEHTAAFAKLVKGAKSRSVPPLAGSTLSGVEVVEVRSEFAPILVGERTNVIGSRVFKKKIAGELWEEAAALGRAQVKRGAQVLDVCLADPDRDELHDTKVFLDVLIRQVKCPLMIDSTDPEVVREALTFSQGKALINSVNFEEGEERLGQVAELARQFGAALVVGTIDENAKQGMAVTRKRKLEIARRAHSLLTTEYRFREEDIYWDPLVFPCGTGDKAYAGSAVETLEGIRAIKKAFPKTRTVLGISNVSFGLPPQGREILNAVFLYHCVEAGLDLAIVNAEKLSRFGSISQQERSLAEDLLWNRGKDPIGAFAAFYRGRKKEKKRSGPRPPLDERLAGCILEGSKDGLIADLKEKLKNTSPLEIINGPLMKGMDEVGRLFGENKLIVAEVLQSAEVMKAAVAFLEPLMEANEGGHRGKVLLATVKGDVHDIGKNLVEIILANNGFEVVDLGIKVPPEKLIEAISTHKPDIIGLSGLLVKSAKQMVITAEDFAKAGIQTPILVGGAALSSRFVDKRIAQAYPSGTVTYAADAMSGLDLAKQIVDPSRFEALKKELDQRRRGLAEEEGKKQKNRMAAQTRTKRALDLAPTVPQPPDFDRHALVGKTPLETLWKFVNPMMLFGRHLGVRGGTVRLLTNQGENWREEIKKADPKGFEVFEAVEAAKERYRASSLLRPSAVFRFFPAHSEGNTVCVAGRRIEFPRRAKEPFSCIADYLDPNDKRGDNFAIFVVTVGQGIRKEAERLKQNGEYLVSHVLQVLALETAEAYAEYLHAQIRRMWGFGDPPEMTMLERFQAKYRGRRYSFGYPACPRLEDQQVVFDLMEPSDIGVRLTDGFMMDPEASVSALVFHHPDASYFSVGAAGRWGDDDE